MGGVEWGKEEREKWGWGEERGRRGNIDIDLK